MSDRRVALIVGVTGITGQNAAQALLDEGWTVFGLSRRAGTVLPGVHHLYADTLDPNSLRMALHGLDISHLIFATWSRQPTEAENCEVNGAMLRNTLEVLVSTTQLDHVSLVTGLKHYLGPFESYAQSPMETPFRENQARNPYPNFYYVQEDILFAAAEVFGFTWSVHRASTIIGWALGNLMNMGVTLALYGSLCRETGAPFVFPGSPEGWNGIVDIVDARLLGRHLQWSLTEPTCCNEAFNVTNGDVFRWRQMWPILAADLGVEPAPYPGEANPLAERMGDADDAWARIVTENELAPTKASDLASWWHTDADLGRNLEAFADMSKSRRAGFLEYKTSADSFLELFEQMRTERIIPRHR